MPRRESLYHRYPEYRVDLAAHPARVRVKLAGQVIADSTATVRVLETRHEPVIYFPRSDVRFEVLEKTDHVSFCPFKGEATYWSIRTGGQTAENAVWGYDEPFEQVAPLAGYVAFYPERVEWEYPD